MSAAPCPVCKSGTSQSLAGLCRLHFYSRVMLPSELGALGLEDTAAERENGIGTMAALESILDDAEAAVLAEVADGRDLLRVVHEHSREPWPRGPLGNIPQKRWTQVLTLIGRARGLRMIRGGSLALLLAPPARRLIVVPSIEDPVEYVAPRGTRRPATGTYTISVVR